MEKAFILGKMAGVMKEIIKWIENMVSGYIFGLMGGNMKAIGLLGNNMEKANISYQMELRKSGFGRMAKESNGWKAGQN
jgi:hypothetical protein